MIFQNKKNRPIDNSRRNSEVGANVLKALGKWILLCIAGGALLRIILLCHPITVASSLSFGQWFGLFTLGIVNDACVAALASIPLACFWMCSGHWRFKKPQCFAFIILLLGLWVYLRYGCRPLWEFNRSFTKILCWVVLGWTGTFMLRAFVPRLRKWWMMAWTAAILFVYLGVMIMNFVGEWFFWNEFGVRYNFIAVDYLVYTSEVIGNIMQSYSMGWIITGVVLATILVETWLFRNTIKDSAEFHLSGWRWQVGSLVGSALVVALIILPLSERAQHAENVWYNGLQANGAYSFVKAFSSNELEYHDFYLLCPPEKARPNLSFKQQSKAPEESDSIPMRKPNIVLVTMESMSADYMSRFGNKENLTPALDTLWNHSIAFENLFAAGNRTVRGLEALTLSRPPSPGESVIKRPVQVKYPSIADKLREMGYSLTFYYGGNSYFDNMENYFTGLGYEIRDRKTMPDANITCQTVWGVCDGDVYKRAIAEMDEAQEGQPQFVHVLTTSNHRPYIYPEGCVSIPPSKQWREGAVMYSDYAVGEFIREASSKPWFDNTVFVICADHCASSAGSTDIPLGNYHIPALIYWPSTLQPQKVEKVVSQMDIMPTLFSLLGWPQAQGLYGMDIFEASYQPRAFVATYQDMGYLRGDTLTVLSPGRNYRQFVWEPSEEDPFATVPVAKPSMGHVYEAASWYQSLDNSSAKK